MAIERLIDASARPLQQRLGEWLQRQAETTRKAYEIELQAFADWAGVEDINIALAILATKNPELNDAKALEDVGLRILDMYLQYQSHLATCRVWDKHGKEKGIEPRIGYAPATQQRRLTAFRGAVKVLQQAQMCPAVVFPAGPAPTVLRDTSGIGRTSWLQVCDTLEYTINTSTPGKQRHSLAVRDHLLLRMMHDLGLRRIEVQRLRLEWLRADGEAIGVWRKGGKEGDRQFTRLGKAMKASLKQWTDIRGIHAGPLFTNWRGTKGITVSAVNKLCTKWGDWSDIGRMTPHQLRHTAITTLAEKTNGNLVQMQAFARHANPSMTQRYIDNRGDAALHSQDLLVGDNEKND